VTGSSRAGEENQMPGRLLQLYLLSSGVLAAAATTPAQPRAVGSLVFTHVNVIDGTGGGLRRDQTVVTQGGRITAVGSADTTPPPAEARVVDASGKFMIPGLWDMHVHTRYDGIDHLRLFIANGVTAVRDMGGPWEHFERVTQWKREITSGDRIGPRIVAAGPLLDGPGSELGFAHIIDGPESGRAVVRRIKAAGADFVKVYDLLGRDAFAAVIDEAARQGLPVAGHPPLAVGVRDVSKAGVLTLEHLGRVMLAASSGESDIMARARALDPAAAPQLIADSRRGNRFEREKAADLAALLAQNRTAVIPTLSNGWTLLASTRKMPRVADRLRYVPPSYRDIWSGAGTADATSVENAREMVWILHAAGVELLAGTDVVKAQFIPGFSLHDELSLLVSAGLSPNEAIEAATRKPARRLGMTDVGTIEPGMRADVLLLDADPLADIENTRRIAAVTVNGRFVDRAALDDMLADIQREAARWNGTPTDRFRAGGKPQPPAGGV
jgi:imidazolonepropionase-like amidohydrolase